MKLLFSISILLSVCVNAQTCKTTVAKDRVLNATLLLTKTDGTIITIPDAWKINVRQEGDKINVIYPDSARVIYRIGKPIPPTGPEPEPAIKSNYGLMQKEGNQLNELRYVLDSANIRLVRVPVFFDDNYKSTVADDYLKAGYHVQLNFNWKNTFNPITFPTDTNFIRSQAEKFFQYYEPYKDQIPVVCAENEWDNGQYRDFTKASIQDYLTELAIVVEVGHKCGFKVADGGITGNGLGRWTFTQLNDADKRTWAQQYYVGQNAENFQPLIAMINAYLQGIKSIPVDYLNFHWYGNKGCYNGLKTALAHYRNVTGKDIPFISNEWGVRDASLWSCTVDEIKEVNPVIGIVYSGTDQDNKAVKVDAEMLELLK